MSTELEGQLGEDLAALAGGHDFEANLDALMRRGQRARRRARATRGVGIGVGVLAVAAGGGVAAANLPTSGPDVQDAAYVTQRVAAVLIHEKDYVVKTSDDGGTTTEYTDPVSTNTYTVGGSGPGEIDIWTRTVLLDHHVHVLNTTVDHRDHTWSTEDETLPAYVPGTTLPPEQGDTITRIQESLRTGEDRVVGTGDYHGHHVTKLAFQRNGTYSELWVDSGTFQPVHSLVRIGPDTTSSDVDWLPRDAGLVHTVNTPDIPAGYAHSATPPPDAPGHGG